MKKLFELCQQFPRLFLGSVATGGASSATLVIIAGVAGFVAGFLIPAVACAVMWKKFQIRRNYVIPAPSKVPCMDIMAMKGDEPFAVMKGNAAYGMHVKEEMIYQEV